MTGNYKSWLNPETFIISDTHFGHKNIVNYQNRPENHNEIIVKNWNNTVSKHSRVLHLGDVFLCPADEARYWLSQLNGDKWLILGNHDTRTLGLYEELGFRIVGEPIYKEFFDFNVIFSHYPLNDLPDNTFNVHGHIHGNTRTGKDAWKNINMSVEVIDYTPVKLREVLKTIGHLRKEHKVV